MAGAGPHSNALPMRLPVIRFMTQPLAGGPSTTLATTTTFSGSIAVGASYVYWTEFERVRWRKRPSPIRTVPEAPG